MDEQETLSGWLDDNKGRITHFRPRRWCGVEYLVAYNRNEKIPYIDGQPLILDTEESAKLITEKCGTGLIDEPHTGLPGSNNY